MAHTPVNHPLRPVYRAIGALMGVYLVVFGVVGFIVTADEGLFGTSADKVLGQDTNLFWSIVSLVLGVIVLGATALGNNRDAAAYTFVGWGLIVVGAYSLAVLRTDVNVLDFDIATIVVNWFVALCLIMSGQYTKVAPAKLAGAPRQVREGAAA
ncbi:DUF4383 domain-containing protein [Krasilnikovia sp. MM14-A1004]|uniref:DUF4383 domain-containing protein n=1 Tax=Krasilnikovia sp. MM14-A1004 TaxID=3373541 RepID=UPI00399D4493